MKHIQSLLALAAAVAFTGLTSCASSSSCCTSGAAAKKECCATEGDTCKKGTCTKPCCAQKTEACSSCDSKKTAATKS